MSPHPDVRTSTTHPLRIDAVAAGNAGGQVGLTFCPGKHDRSLEGFLWARDLDADLARIHAWQPGAMLTLIEPHEFALLGVPDLGARVAALGIPWHHLPIRDVDIPDDRFERAWGRVGPALVELLRGGGRVVVHCRGGKGRAGTIAARLLVELGALPHAAVKAVRAVRHGAIETPAQEAYVHALRFPCHAAADPARAAT